MPRDNVFENMGTGFHFGDSSEVREDQLHSEI